VARFTTFRFCLNPTVGQELVLRRHAGAARFGYNQCLRLVKQALDGKRLLADELTTSVRRASSG
jgi:putative transposase